MAIYKKLAEIALEVQKELLENPEAMIDLSLGSVAEDPAQAVPVLIERMDKVCGLMDFQATIIERAESGLENARYRYKRSEKERKKKFNESYIKFKQEDRVKKEKKTDPEYIAMAELECDILENEELTAERTYVAAQHALADAKHAYDTLNNHFLSYRKSCDLLKSEMEKLGAGESRKYPMGGR